MIPENTYTGSLTGVKWSIPKRRAERSVDAAAPYFEYSLLTTPLKRNSSSMAGRIAKVSAAYMLSLSVYSEIVFLKQPTTRR